MSNIIDVDILPEINELVSFEPDDPFVSAMALHVANGGTTTSFCSLKNVNHGAVMVKVRQVPYWNNVLLRAEKDRKEWLKEKLLEILKGMLDFDPRTAYDDLGRFKQIPDMPAQTAKMIKKAATRHILGAEDVPEIVDAVEFYDLQKAIDQIGKYIKMFVDTKDPADEGRTTLADTVHASFREDER